jgi:phosphoribosylaminoimidazole carboxylase PurE protein
MSDDESSSSTVFVVLGSPADMPWAERIAQGLKRFDVAHEIAVASAHKTPEFLLERLRKWEGRSEPHVYITVAGRSNALSGFVDAQVTAPVIACPPASEAFGGMDILSSLRMPRGVAPVVVLEPENAALAAVKMLGLTSDRLRDTIARSQSAERQRVVGGQK